MNPTELRIGIYTRHRGYEPYAIKATDIMHCQSYPQAYDSIPISSLYLIDFGFTEVTEVEDESRCFELNAGRKSFRLVQMDDGLWLTLYQSNIGMNFQDIVDLEYVHQLQNLFFSLTGNELTF